MRPGTEISMLDVLIYGLERICSPAGAAARLQARLNARSLEETAAAAEREGYEVCHADLPENVSGFADIIEGQPYIVLNRAKSRNNLEYTLSHELAHQVLHLNPSRDTSPSEFPAAGMEELEAHLFAVAWITWAGSGRHQEEVLLENPEASVAVRGWLFFMLLLVVVVLIGYICSKLFSPQRPILPEVK
jgi:IrrE N-terminal-like domain